MICGLIFLNPNCKGDNILFVLKNEYSLVCTIFSRIFEKIDSKLIGLKWSAAVGQFFWGIAIIFAFLKWDGKVSVVKDLLKICIKTVSTLFGADLTIYEGILSHPELNFEAKLFTIIFISEGLVGNKNKDDLKWLSR